MKSDTLRVVVPFLNDEDKRIPYSKKFLLAPRERLTRLSDLELKSKIPVQRLLEKHNKYRTKLVDVTSTCRRGKLKYLKPIKADQLKWSVLTIAIL